MGTGARPLCSETLKDNSLGVGGELLPLYQVRILQRLYSLPLEVRLTLRVRASGICGWSRGAPEEGEKALEVSDHQSFICHTDTPRLGSACLPL